jgi:hypothetical protein
VANDEEPVLSRALSPESARRQKRGALVGILRNLLLSEYFILYLTLTFFVLMAGFFPDLASARNISNQLSNVWPLAAVAIGQTFVIIITGIDLSQGAIMGFVSVAGAVLLDIIGATVIGGTSLAGGKGKIATIGMPYSLWRIDERERGLREAIAGSGLEIVARQSGLDQAKIQDSVSGILTAHPDLAGIWCAFSNQIVGAADALRMAGRKDVVLTGIDADRAIIERIRSGWVTGAAAQFPAEQGRLAAEAAFNHLQGQPVAAGYEVPVGLVTRENAQAMSAEIWGQ